MVTEAGGPETTTKPTPEERLREVVGGDRRAAIRRIILWVLAFALIASDAPSWMALLPMALLCTTDGLL